MAEGFVWPCSRLLPHQIPIGTFLSLHLNGINFLISLARVRTPTSPMSRFFRSFPPQCGPCGAVCGHLRLDHDLHEHQVLAVVPRGRVRSVGGQDAELSFQPPTRLLIAHSRRNPPTRSTLFSQNLLSPCSFDRRRRSQEWLKTPDKSQDDWIEMMQRMRRWYGDLYVMWFRTVPQPSIEGTFDEPWKEIAERK